MDFNLNSGLKKCFEARQAQWPLLQYQPLEAEAGQGMWLRDRELAWIQSPRLPKEFFSRRTHTYIGVTPFLDPCRRTEKSCRWPGSSRPPSPAALASASPMAVVHLSHHQQRNVTLHEIRPPVWISVFSSGVCSRRPRSVYLCVLKTAVGHAVFILADVTDNQGPSVAHGHTGESATRTKV